MHYTVSLPKHLKRSMVMASFISLPAAATIGRRHFGKPGRMTSIFIAGGGTSRNRTTCIAIRWKLGWSVDRKIGHGVAIVSISAT